MKITVLGNNSTTVTQGGACSSYLLEVEGRRILLDMGNGSIFNLKKRVKLHEIDAIILTHHHFDHLSDLFLFRYEREGHKYMGEEVSPIDLYTPEMPQWLQENLMKNDLFRLHVIKGDTKVSMGDLTVAFIEVLHLLETYALRFTHDGKIFTYSADTGVCDGIYEAAREADLFLCEASYGSYEPYRMKHHLHGAEAGEIAEKCGVKKLLLTHLPEENLDGLLQEARAVHEDTEISEILKTYEV
ncbi:MBL fold metallo-hydrolase [Proteiniclasticum sp. C24MP]|uniref:MBL fold metallo-hydrolase n=1 Tax=Proteiniclasticum sp. C24MP TaxID=3374101 RepID=UPI003753FDBD